MSHGPEKGEMHKGVEENKKMDETCDEYSSSWNSAMSSARDPPRTLDRDYENASGSHRASCSESSYAAR